MIFIEGKERVQETQQRLEAIGLVDLRTAVAATAVCLGAKEVLAVHGKSPKQLQLMFKTDGTQSPRTVADLRSGTVIKGLVKEIFPFAQINEEETGLTRGFFDFAGRLLIIEAGGEFTDQFGNHVHKDTQFGMGSNGWLHNTLISITQEVYRNYQGYNPNPR